MNFRSSASPYGVGIRKAPREVSPAVMTPGGTMKLLLTSSGISNTSIRDALVDLLGKPIAESSALCIPTGVQPFPGGPSHVYRFISGSARVEGARAITVSTVAMVPSALPAPTRAAYARPRNQLIRL